MTAVIRFSAFSPTIGMNCFYALLAAHHALFSKDVGQAMSNYSISGNLGLVWC